MMTNETQQIIQDELASYANDCNFEVIEAVDYGSRSRGLEHDGSDYDVFFIFTQPPEEYATGTETETYVKSVYSDELGTEIELHGWNLKKFIGNDGLAGSNPTAIEFCTSPVKYMEYNQRNWVTMIHEARKNFKPYALIRHYQSLAENNYRKYIEQRYKLADDKSYNDILDESNVGIEQSDIQGDIKIQNDETKIGVTLFGDYHTLSISNEKLEQNDIIEPTTTDRTVKRYANICRALLAMKYIEHWKIAPPSSAEQLLDECIKKEIIDDEISDKIAQLFQRKKNGDGSETQFDDKINDFIEDEIERDIDPDGYVERQPDKEKIRAKAKEVYQNIDFK